MELRSPLTITPRLMVGVRVGNDAFISIDFSDRPGDGGRSRYAYAIDVGRQSYEAEDLQSVQGGDLVRGLRALLAFLSAAANAPSDNADLFFPEWLMEWAGEHANDLELLGMELDILTLD